MALCMWLYEKKDWPNFTWNDKVLASLLAEARHRQGRLLGKMEALCFSIRLEASLNILTTDVVTSSAIEGERLDVDEVIHPFEDGNGRIVWAIADMALARADGTSNRFYSMSRQIEQERKAYYTQLERQQKGSVDITSYTVFFDHG